MKKAQLNALPEDSVISSGITSNISTVRRWLLPRRDEGDEGDDSDDGDGHATVTIIKE